METSQTRPAAVTIVGWLFVLLSVFLLLTGAVAVASMVVVDSAAREGVPQAMEGAPAMFYVGLVFVRYFGALGFFQVIVALALMFSASQFMKLRAWARAALEVFSWLSLICIVAVGSLWVYSWFKMTSAMPAAMTAPLSPETFTYLGALLWGVLALALGMAVAAMIRFLRSDSIRKAVS